VISEPEPTTVLMVPAPMPASRMIRKSVTDIDRRRSIGRRDRADGALAGLSRVRHDLSSLEMR
jgi:hypothetical protein